MTLGEKQRRFARLVGHLLLRIQLEGHEATFGWAYRPPECAEHLAREGRGIRSSLHTQRLAVDLNLFRDGRYLTETEDHAPFGAFWETLDPLCRWGGRWGDGNHYSLEHDGVQ